MKDNFSVPPGAPAWVTTELIAHTIRVWQPYYDTPLTAEDALAMILGVTRLVGQLYGGRTHETVCSAGAGE